MPATQSPIPQHLFTVVHDDTPIHDSQRYFFTHNEAQRKATDIIFAHFKYKKDAASNAFTNDAANLLETNTKLTQIPTSNSVKIKKKTAIQ